LRQCSHRYPDEVLAELVFTDDIVLMENTIKDTENLLHKVESAGKSIGLFLNITLWSWIPLIFVTLYFCGLKFLRSKFSRTPKKGIFAHLLIFAHLQKINLFPFNTSQNRLKVLYTSQLHT